MASRRSIQYDLDYWWKDNLLKQYKSFDFIFKLDHRFPQIKQITQVLYPLPCRSVTLYNGFLSTENILACPGKQKNGSHKLAAVLLPDLWIAAA
jgi:hypothetical protein